MDYKLNITFHGNKMFDEIVYYLIYQLHGREVAEKLFTSCFTTKSNRNDYSR